MSIPQPVKAIPQVIRPPRGWGDLAKQVLILATFSVAYEATAAGMHGDRQSALTHAGDIVRVERTFGLLHEHAVQQFALHAPGLVIDLANWTYINSQFAVAYLLLGWIYWRRTKDFKVVRNAVLGIDLLGLIGYVVFPAAPPRMLPGLGIIDTVSRTGINQSSGLIDRLSDPYGAMPSLHIAYAVLLGGAVAYLVKHPLVKVASLAYPALVLFAVIATGNHFFLDALAGALLATAMISAQVVLIHPGVETELRRRGAPASHSAVTPKLETMSGLGCGATPPTDVAGASRRSRRAGRV